MNQADIIQIANYCQAELGLKPSSSTDEDYYCSLPLCVIDTVFSIGALYQSTLRTVKRFCDYFGVEMVSTVRDPDPGLQLPVSRFLALFDSYGVERMAGEVFQNRQRTSTRNGILKAEAVYRVCKLLQSCQVEYMQDVSRIIGDPGFEEKFREIPGQTSGISLRYFYMLVGSEDYVKPDRMVARFIKSATGKEYSVEDMHLAIVGAAKVLKKEYPNLTPRKLDSLIWNFQRTRSVP
jgi:hypothetical protein